MSKTHLTIRELQNVMDWSYPTALKFAKQSGTIEKGEHGPDMWIIPASVVWNRIDQKESELIAMKARMMRVEANGR